MNRKVNRKEFIDIFDHSTAMSDTHTTKNEQLTARTLHEKNDDTRMHATHPLIEAAGPGQEARKDTVVYARFILGYRAGPPTLIPDSDNERRFFIRDEAGAVRALDLGAGAGPSGAAGVAGPSAAAGGGVAGAGGLNLGGAVAEEE